MSCQHIEARICQKLKKLGLLGSDFELYIEKKEQGMAHALVMPAKNKQGAFIIGIFLEERMDKYADEYLRLLVGKVNRQIKQIQEAEEKKYWNQM